MNRASPRREIGVAVGNAGFTRGWGRPPCWQLGWRQVLLGFFPLVALGGCASLHSSLRTLETKPETQGVVPPILTVRMGLGLALSHWDRDVEALSLGSFSRVSGSGPTGCTGPCTMARLSSLAIRLAMGPARRPLTGRTKGTLVPSLLLSDS